MKALVIAEKPSVARDIARVLKCGKKINGAIEGERYIVTWGLGSSGLPWQIRKITIKNIKSGKLMCFR